MVKVYTDKRCKYCNELKDKLNKYNIIFEDIDVDLEKNSAEVKKIFEMAGEVIIPIITIKPHLLDK